MEKIYLAFIWHMHQPYYKNLFTGEYLLPWVLLHGTKDYYDMAYMLKEFDGLRQNFNLVPSLLSQLFDYQNLDAKDSYLEVFRKRPQDLSEAEKTFLLMNFFSANWENMIKPYPRYYELLKKRGFYYPKGDIGRIKEYFTDEDLRDIQVLFFLSWIDPIFFDFYDGLKFLKLKGKAFSEDDKKIIEDVQKSILKGIIPLYRELASTGKIEISTSPFYHPIIPLLIDNTIAREAMPDVVLPEKIFAKPEDASHQVKRAIELFHRIFQCIPKGMWPPEGSVSDETLQLYMEQGIEWIATDEEILYQSFKLENKRDGGGYLLNPEMLYKPYRYEKGNRCIDVVFRDKYLSDLISFHYAKMNPKEAAKDFMNRIKKIEESVRGKVQKPLVTIAMDGENAWENYGNDGIDFLKFLYEGILKEGNIISTTISDYLKSSEEFGLLHHSYAGSWIGHNFSIWIGHVEDNTGWTLLSNTREFLEAEDPDRNNKKAWESIYIAEGSDWFWWYGDEHSSENDEIFDFLFRENLSNVYRFLGKEPPEVLSIPIILEDREIRPTRDPVNFISPKIDGVVTSYFDWMGAGFVEGRGHGVAMHESISLLKGCYFGFNEHLLFLRADIDKAYVQQIEDVSFEINLMGKKDFKIIYHAKQGLTDNSLPLSIAFSEILEMGIPFNTLGVVKDDKVRVWISLKIKEMLVDRIPKRGYFSVSVPSEMFEMEMWYV
ncbi:MAG: glycoside hydrolase family 57 protein [Proteobacteria bacterium]|nr:glycoside hydrolase family 57 protein [Pseudomonadota bacterium]